MARWPRHVSSVNKYIWRYTQTHWRVKMSFDSPCNLIEIPLCVYGTSVRVVMESLSGGRWGFWQTRAIRRSRSWSLRLLGGGSKRQLTCRASAAASCSWSRPTETKRFAMRTSSIPRESTASRGTHSECWRRPHIDGKSAGVPWVSGSSPPLFWERPAQTLGRPAACSHYHLALLQKGNPFFFLS